MELEVIESKAVAKVNWAPQTFEQGMKLAELVAGTGFAPKTYKGKPEECLMAMMAGNEVGLGPMASLQNIAVINGYPSVFGDAALALVKASSDYEFLHETFSEDGKTAICQAKRKGEQESVRTFSMEDAAKAGLLNKDGPWKQYTKRMLQMRARAWAIRDVWPHVLKGLSIKEEIQDISDPVNVTPNAEPEPLKPNPIDEQRERLDTILANAIEAGKATKAEADEVVTNSKKYNTAEVLRKFIDKVDEKLNDTIEGDAE